MHTSDYRYVMMLFRDDLSDAGSVAVPIDFDPAVEFAHLYHVRRGDLPFQGGGFAAVEPLWHKTEGEPHARGFRVVHDHAGRKFIFDYPSSYFREAAALAAAELVKRGKLTAGDQYLFQALAFDKSAFAGNGNNRPPARLAMDVVEEKPALQPVASRLEAFRGRSAPVGPACAGDMPVFLSPRVLADVAAFTHACEGRETGGILIGRLHHDATLPEIFAEVTAQVPAEHTLGTVARLTFTPETWSAANAAIQLRQQGEIYLGYWHSHPVREWCRARECSLEKQKVCRLAKDFFSEDDVAVMRACFPRAYSLGLVANDTAFSDVSFSLFGWRDGRIGPRGFYLLEEESNAKSGAAAR